MDILKNVNIEQINAAVKDAIATKKSISSLKKEVLQLSKDVIEYAEAGNISAADDALFASRRKINKIKAYLASSPINLHFQSDLLYSVEKEYCEALIVCFVMKNKEIPPYDELNVDPLVYIHSFVEAVSELGKINEKLENRARIAANKLAMQEIFDRLGNMKHYAGNVTGDMDNQLDKLRHKIYTGKTDVIIDKNDAEALAERLQREGFANPRDLRRLPDAKHVFTHRVWRMQGWMAACDAAPASFTPVDAAALEARPFPSARAKRSAMASAFLPARFRTSARLRA